MSNLYDRSRPVTNEDLIRRYNLDGVSSNLNTLKKTTSSGLTKVENQLNNFVKNTYTPQIKELQDQIDGQLTTWFYNGEPTLENLPASEWTTDAEKKKHIGDLYYDKDTGYGYRFMQDSETLEFSWLEVKDSSATEALGIANEALDIAKDHKRRIFFPTSTSATPIPPYDYGDIWFKDNNDIYRCVMSRAEGDSYVSTDWVEGTKYVDSTAVQEAISSYDKTTVQTTYVTTSSLTKGDQFITARVDTVEEAVDTKNQIFVEEPTTPYYIGDIYLKPVTIEGDDGTTYEQKLLYVCQVDRLEGNYDPSDFNLQPTYASQAELELTDSKFSVELAKKVDGEDVTKAYLIQKITDGKSSTVIGSDEISLEGSTINLTSDDITIDSTNFKVDKDGNITAKNGTLTNVTIDGGTGSFNGVADTPIVTVYDTLSGYSTNLWGGSMDITDGDNNTLFKINQGGIYFKDINLNDNSILWSGSPLYMKANQTATLKDNISNQANGIVLVWSYYTNNTAQDYYFNTTFIPKEFVNLHSGGGVSCILTSPNFGTMATKYVYITDTKITGNENNTATGTGTSGIKYTNNAYVLRYVIGV